MTQNNFQIYLKISLTVTIEIYQFDTEGQLF